MLTKKISNLVSSDGHVSLLVDSSNNLSKGSVLRQYTITSGTRLIIDFTGNIQTTVLLQLANYLDHRSSIHILHISIFNATIFISANKISSTDGALLGSRLKYKYENDNLKVWLSTNNNNNSAICLNNQLSILDTPNVAPEDAIAL